ncbi:ACP S-malonyltransferase [Bacillus haikouensis]|uniref:ACP S-malonyltransferase n=1 Tax=Bacillus haikouensis TaxID=1510468 RepID=UPI0015567DC2|nr:ACP S-malonyltransferase [Bacillus haikouensis]NQD67336.1 ACP S-malonyltransferase [Bacillus haikouensis]
MKSAILFPPLMTLKAGSFSQLYNEFPEVRKKFKESSSILGLDLAEHFFSEDESVINRGEVARPSIVTISTALYEMVIDKMEKPAYYLGPSLGQVTAIHCSGALGFEDTIRMVKAMCDFEEMNERNKEYGVFFFYNIDCSIMEENIKIVNDTGGYAEPCMYATSNQMIVNGDFPSLERLAQMVLSQGGLGVTIPFGPPGHCSLLTDVQHRFTEQFMPTINPLNPQAPLVSNVDGSVIMSAEDVRDELIGQYVTSVQWYKSLEYLKSKGVDKLVVLGPGQFIPKSLQFTDIPFEVETLVTMEEVKNKLIDYAKEQV